MKKLVVIFFAVAMLIMITAAVAMAAEKSEGGGGDWGILGLAISSGIGMGLAALGGALGQGRATSTALEGIARNPGAADKIFLPMIIGLALIESLVLYTFIIAIFLQGKI